MLDLECREESEDALGTPEPETKLLGNVRDLVGVPAACLDHSPSFLQQTPVHGSLGREENIRGDLGDELTNMLLLEKQFLVDPSYLDCHRRVTAASRLELVQWIIRVSERSYVLSRESGRSKRSVIPYNVNSPQWVLE